MRLVERKLATALGIGQPTLREALKELEYQGFVRKTPQRGTHVSNFTQDELRKIMEVRIVLEAFAVERAAINMTAEAELKLEALLGQMSAGANSSDLATFHDADVGFHRELWALSGNEYLAASLEGMALRLFVFGALNRGPNQLPSVVEQHKGILEGLRSRDPEKARAAFVSQIVNFWNEYDRLGAELTVSLTDNLRRST
jgi:DNA-binding GntR family transcriptional regulator